MASAMWVGRSLYLCEEGCETKEVWFVMGHFMGGAKIGMKVRRRGMWVGKGRWQCEASAAATRTLGGRIDEAADVHPRPRPRKGTNLRSGTRAGLGRCRVRSGGRGWSRAPVGVRKLSEAPPGPAHFLRSIPCLVTREEPVSCWTVQSCERRAST